MGILIAGKQNVYTGDRFGYLEVVGEKFAIRGNSRQRTSVVVCICDCGRYAVISVRNLKSGRTKSCGCLAISNRLVMNITHGKSTTKLYAVWNAMIGRCKNRSNRSYKDYGGRGVSVCSEWIENSSAFMDWAIASGWKQGLQLDRIDNDGNYEPENCRFVTRSVNTRNRRCARLLSATGETLNIAEWARRLNTSAGTIAYRIKSGWSVERAVTTPVRKHSRCNPL